MRIMSVYCWIGNSNNLVSKVCFQRPAGTKPSHPESVTRIAPGFTLLFVSLICWEVRYGITSQPARLQRVTEALPLLDFWMHREQPQIRHHRYFKMNNIWSDKETLPRQLNGEKRRKEALMRVEWKIMLRLRTASSTIMAMIHPMAGVVKRAGRDSIYKDWFHIKRSSVFSICE